MAVNSQHRCVFVGNIPYDATEEELVQLCEEVGPVVSFRLVTDKETGKPKGYGFCEYKDEETALSARRNLHNQEFHGRQLRVDFAENDKNADRSREQGRGGPGLATNTDPQKHFGGPAVRGDSSLLQPVGHSVAMNAASVMAGALGGTQTSINPSQSGLQMQPIGTDPLTLHLASMSKIQLNEILTDLKVMATQNKEQARQLLLSNPLLSKAVFQAHLMLGMVSPQMLQMPNIRQVSGPHVQVLPQYGQGVQQTAIQTVSGIPPLAQHKLPIGFAPQPQSQTSALQQVTSLIPSQYSTMPLPTQPRFQTPLIAQHQVLQQPPLRGTLGVPTPPSLHPQPANLYNRQETQITVPLSVKQMRPSLVQHSGQIVSASPGTNTRLVASVQPSLLTRTPLGDNGFQTGPSIMSATPISVNKDSGKMPHFSSDPTWVYKGDTYPSLAPGLHEKSSLVKDIPDKIYHPSKLMKLEDGRSAPFSTADVHVSTSVSRHQMSKAGPSDSPKQDPELPPDVDPALLQQVLNLMPEQLSLLPPDQQQEVIQLQQRYRQLG